MALIDKLTAIGNAIRSKTNTSANMTLTEMANAITNIQTGSGSSDTYLEFGGKNPELIDEYSHTYKLSDTTFDGTNTSTSSINIMAAVTDAYISEQWSASDVRDVVAIQTLTVKPTYNSSATDNARMVTHSLIYYYALTRRRNSYDNENSYTTATDTASQYMIDYYTTLSKRTLSTANYGLYGTLTSPTISGSSLNFKSPALYSRVNSSYSKADNMSAITDCDFIWTVKIYLVDKHTTMFGAVVDLTEQKIFG